MENIFIDIGNTNLKIFIKNEEKEYQSYSFDSQEKFSEIEKFIKSKSKKYCYIISSVKPSKTKQLLFFFRSENIKYYLITNQDYKNYFQNLNDNLKEMGSDRMLNIIALKNTRSKSIIFDLGSALTLDVINHDLYITGFIYPGFNILKKALFEGAELLNNINYSFLQKDKKALTTESQINDGIIYGMLGVINQYITVLNNLIDINEYSIYLTGSGFKILEKNLNDNLNKFFKFNYILDYKLNLKGFEKIAKDIEKGGKYE